MKCLTNEMIHDFRIMKLGYDFCGYEVKRKNELSYHHLITPKRECKEQGLGQGLYYWNGAILVQKTSHDYLHNIERIDPEIFYLITSEMIDENLKGYLDTQNLLAIDDLLTYFEREHCSDRTNNGVPIIKEQYTRRLVRNGKFGR